MKNSLLLNNFVHERPTTAHVKQANGTPPRQSIVNTNRAKTEFIDLSARQSSEFGSPRDTSSRFTYRLKSKLIQNSARNSTCSQTLDSDEDISISDLEDDYVDNNFGNKANNYWASLDDSIKRINDDSDKLALKPRPNFKSSNTFKDVMHEMSGNVEYGVSKGYTLLKQKISRLTDATSITALALSKAAKINDEPEEEEIKKEESDSEDERQEVINRENREKELVSTVGGAKRAWRVLKTHVRETGVENRTSSVKMNWEAIRHHVQGITDLDRAKQDLYERYGFLPTVQEDGTKVCKNVMWLNRTRAIKMQNETQNLIHGRLRAQSARPFTGQNFDRIRNLSGNKANGYKRPVSCDIPNGDFRPRVRPSSEKVTRNRLRPTSVKPKKMS